MTQTRQLPMRATTPRPRSLTPISLSLSTPTPTPALGNVVTEPLSISDREFTLLRTLIEREAGIHLSSAKKALVISRLSRRLRALGLTSFGEYHEVVRGPLGAEERVHMLDAISTNETSFFREQKHFELLIRDVLPAWREAAAAGRRPRFVRVWSAGCSTGEEPYSLAMVLLKHLPPGDGWRIEILATDLSTRVLERARNGMWPIEKAEAIPGEYRREFMLRGVRAQEGTMKAGPELRQVVRFFQLNLTAESYPVPQACDLVFCRNVLIYFDQPVRVQVTTRLIGHLQAGGYLFLGHAETLHASCMADVVTVIPTVYMKRRSGSTDACGRSP